MAFELIIDSIFQAAINSSVLEWLAFITAFVYVIFAAYEIIWCWLFALISTALYFFVCYEAELYLETLLQVFYFIMGFYGWYQWSNKNDNESILPIISFPVKKILPLVIAGAIISPIIGFLFEKLNSSQPYLDAAITIFSLIATWMVAKKIIENWIFWIIIDFSSIILYSNKQLFLTAFLFFIYTVISVFGYYQWKKILLTEKN